jgi:hypothetical protein
LPFDLDVASKHLIGRETVPGVFSAIVTFTHYPVLELFWSPPAMADRLAPAMCIARASEPVTPAA